jgi:hypothetical protein
VNGGPPWVPSSITDSSPTSPPSTTAQPTAVGLADRGGRDRLGVQLGERLLDRAPEPASSSAGPRPGVAATFVLEPGQLGDDAGQQVGPGGQELVEA